MKMLVFDSVLDICVCKLMPFFSVFYAKLFEENRRDIFNVLLNFCLCKAWYFRLLSLACCGIIFSTFAT